MYIQKIIKKLFGGSYEHAVKAGMKVGTGVTVMGEC